jgi:hypothetical protein
MKIARTTALILLTASLIACSSISVSSDYDVTVDFDSLRSYDWTPKVEAEDDDPRLNNSLLDGRVRRAVDYELAQRGFERDVEGSPDFWVTYHVGFDRKLDVTTVQSYPGYYGGYRNWGGYSETRVREYDEGSLLIDVVDPKNETLIWRGSAFAPLRERATPEERTARIDEVVGAVMKKFPPQPRK